VYKESRREAAFFVPFPLMESDVGETPGGVNALKAATISNIFIN